MNRDTLTENSDKRELKISPPLPPNVSQIVRGRKQKPLVSPQNLLFPFPRRFLWRTPSPLGTPARGRGAQERREPGKPEARAGSSRLPPASASPARRRDSCGSCAPRARFRRGLARRPRPGLSAPRRRPFPAARAREAARRRTSGRRGGTYQLLPDPAPHAPAVAVPVPRDAGAEGLQVEADEPEGEAGVPLWLKFRSPPPPPHSPRRVPISPRRPRGPTGAAPAPPPPGAAEPAAAPQPPSLLTVVTRSTTTTPPPPSPAPQPHPSPPPAPWPAPGRDERGCADRGAQGAQEPSGAGGQPGGRGRQRAWRGAASRTRLLPFAPLSPSPGVGLNRVCLRLLPTPLFLPPVAGLWLSAFFGPPVPQHAYAHSRV